MQPENLAGQPHLPPVDLLAGRYRVSTRLLGRGALADVWAGLDEVLDRPVAIKTFRPGTEATDKQRFSREIRTLAGLSHPHLISLYDAGDVEGRAYLVMRQVSGGTLGARMRALGTLPADAVRRIGAQMTSALAYIHGRGVVHRDVKPANILLEASGAAVLADFGIARLIDATQLTSTGVTVGTAAYLSPEQVRGRGVGPASDVYALGLVLLEALTGRREYPGEPIEAAVARLYRNPAVPENLPYGLTGLLRTMTADDPSNRATASHVCRVLSRVVPTEPGEIRVAAGVTPTGPSDTMPMRPQQRRHRRAAWLAPAGLAIAATVGVVALRPGSLGGASPAPHRPAPTTSHGSAGLASGSGGAPTTSNRPKLPSAASAARTPGPQPGISVASVSVHRVAPPGRQPGHGKGHGKGPHKPHG